MYIKKETLISDKKFCFPLQHKLYTLKLGCFFLINSKT